MYFKSLQLQGFKSFASKTKLDFVDGVTAVVGPNGSGKSNIADALRWVMGEMSAKSLRGSKMEDVIFNGTDKRTPMAFAEVTITMDNSDRSLNMDFDEISVTRRVYRSGESEYQINNATCRLKDIHELFMDTGLGRDGYSIVGQGKIDEILSAKSEDRRHIFDEAAGITKYRYKKEEAERKLSQTNDNLMRVEDILTEIGNNLTPLEHQAKKARKYLSLREIQKKLEINLWLRTLDSFSEQLSKIEDTYKIALENKSTYESKVEKAETDLLEKKENYRHLEGEIDESRANVYAQKNEITRVLGEIEITKTKIENHKKDIVRLETESSLHKEKLSSLRQDIASKKQENTILTDKHKEFELILKNLEEEHQKTTDHIAELNAKLKEARDNLSLKQSELSSGSAKIETSSGYFESLRERLASILAEKSASVTKQVELEKELSEVAENLKNLAKSATETRDNSAEISEKLDDIKKNISSNTSLLDELSVEEKSLEHKKITLESMENTFDGYPYSVKSIMNEVKSGELKGSKIHGPLSSLISTDSKYIQATSAALGGALNHIVADTEEDAKLAIEFLKKTKGGRATFLPVSSVKGPVADEKEYKNEKGYIGIASNLVKIKKEFENIISGLLGKTVVMDNMDNAVLLARKTSYKFKIVTLDGEVLNPGGSVSGGQSKGSSNSLSRNNELEKISKRISEISKEKENINSKLSKLSEELSVAQKEYDIAYEKMWQSKSELVTEKTRLENLQLNLKSEKDRISAVEKEAVKVEELINSTNAEKQSILSGNEKITLEIESLTALIETIEKDIVSYSDYLAELTEKLSFARTDAAVSRKDMEIAEAWVLEAENTAYSTEIEISNKAIFIETLKNDIIKYEQNIILFEEKIEDLKLTSSSGETSIDTLTQKRETEEKEIEEKEKEISSLKDSVYKLREELARIESKKARLEETHEDIVSKMWEEYELTYSTADTLREDIGSEAEATKQLQSTKAGIKALGNVNVDSIEEYAVQKERFDFLSGQKKDLEEAKSGLNNLISEMTVIMTEMFEENFTKLNKTFGETFSDLFGGGKAGIRLSDPDDVLGSGVEIDVQPPGKKLQSITLLSGGEKAFTAIALIFAILKIKPTYFCIFDEIEAALDDVNVFRYADYLKKFSEQTQFILITHRKGTMEIADTLYGVTMQEKGITTLLSLDLDTYKE